MDTRFQRVWERVTAPKHETETEKLEAFLLDEERDAEAYENLARCTASLRVKRLFLRLAADEREHVKQLRSMAFLLGGESHVQVKRKPAPCGKGIFRELRKRYSAENESAAAYTSAAADACSEQLRELYTRLAAEERKHGDMLWSLMKGWM